MLRAPRLALACLLLTSPALAGAEGEVAAGAAVAAVEVLDADVRAALAAARAAGTDALLPAYVVLRDQLGASALTPGLRALPQRERRGALAQRMKAHAARSQGAVRALLAAAQSAGRARDVHVLWMGNAVVFQAQPDVIEALAELPGIDRIRLNPDPDPAAVQDATAAPLAPPAPPAPAVPAVPAARAAPAAPAALSSPLAPYPFADDFESGALQPWWTVATTGSGYATVSSANGPVDSFHVLMATSVNGVDSTASLTLCLDLVGQSDVGLRFQHKSFSDDANAEDGVFLSEDGVTWHLALSLQGGTTTYTAKTLNLDQAVAGLGLSYTNNFRVRLQWRDNLDIPSDGFGFDNVELGPGLYVPPPPLPEQNLTALQAPSLWALGFRGEGVLVGTIDSGVLITHPDLVNRIWSNPGEVPGNGLDDDANGYIDDVHGWDFIHDSSDVTSADPHGTSSAGIAVGDGSGGKATGMAPGATLLVCEVLSQGDYWLAQQYCLDQGVDVLTSSYSYKWADIPQPDYHMFRQLAEVELAAGMIHANSIGNQGTLLPTYPVPFNIATPGNCPSPFAHPQNVLGGHTAVLGCGGIQLPLDTLYNPSGRGPAAWENITLYKATYPYPQSGAYWDYPYGGFGGGQPGLLKPDLMAYAINVATASIATTYTTFSGTSAATPHLGGALALLRQLQPEAEPRHLAAALELTAKDLGVAGKDNLYGAGKLAVFDAGRRLRLLVRASDPTPSLGSGFTLDVFGYPAALSYGWFGAVIFDNPTAFNLAAPYFGIGLLPLDAGGSAALPLVIPNSPILVGLTVWFQFGAHNDDPAWGAGPLLSVPEPITIAP